MRRNFTLESLRLTPLAEEETGYIPPEEDAKCFPFCGATPEHLALWERTTFQRFRQVRIFLALLSKSWQVRNNIWNYRDVWAFPTLAEAKAYLEPVYGGGLHYVVRVLELPGMLVEAPLSCALFTSFGPSAQLEARSVFGPNAQPEPCSVAPDRLKLMFLKLMHDSALLRATGRMPDATRALSFHLLREKEKNLVAWAAPLEASWQQEGAVVLPHKLHQLESGWRWSARSIDLVEESEEGGVT